jgi:type II secretory pathway component PulJ
MPETGRMPPRSIRLIAVKKGGFNMWEALAAMTLICVLILVAYQMIEKFRERHV